MKFKMAIRPAWLLCFAALALLATSVVLALLNGLRSTSDWGTGAYPLLVCVPGATCPIVGALILSGRPGNKVGWVCLAIGVGIGSQLVATQYGLYALDSHSGGLPGGRLFAWYGYWASFPYTASVFLILLFPTGRLVSRRWRVVGVSTALAIIAGNVSAALTPGVMNPFGVRNPAGIDGARSVLDVVEAVSFPLLAVSAIGAAASMLVRFRTGEGVERQQIKWFAVAAALLAASVPLEPVSPLAQDLVTVVLAGLPAAAGVAILRYGLYDIDVVINRALVYGGLTATLAGAYLGAVLVLQLVMSPGSDIAVAGSTLAVAGLFRPARTRIQAVVDRRFFRHKYDAGRTLATFGTRVRDQVDLLELEADLRGVVVETMQPAHVSLWLRDP